jgi:hypothetical protein
MLVSGICQNILVERLDKFPEPIDEGYLSSLETYRLGIFVLSRNQYFFGKYHLQVWYISIIPPNMWLSLHEDKSREHRNVKVLLFLITIYF